MKINVQYSIFYDYFISNLVEIEISEEIFEKRKIETEIFILNLLKLEKDFVYNKINEIENIFIKFNENIIPIYILPDFFKNGVKSFSNPITIKFMFNKIKYALDSKKYYRFISLIILHELCHKIQEPLLKTKYFEDLNKKYSQITSRHILTFAILKSILSKDDYRLHIDSLNNLDYIKALEVVESNDIKKIILNSKEYL